MILSASRRTDIPAYFGEKFYKDLTSGKFIVINPFNQKKTEVNIKKEDIDGIVFWTKNPKPFFKILKKIKDEDYKFYFQYTLNNYPKDIEPLNFSFSERISHLKKLYEIIYPYKIFLRYDPIILTNRFNDNFHIENFELLIENVYKYVEKIIIAFVTVYKKIKKFFPDVNNDEEVQFNLLEKFSKIGKKYNKKLYICCYKKDIGTIEILPSKCIDASIFKAKPQKHLGQRTLCNCDKSIDVGYYRTCKTGCLYCYAK